MKIAFLTETQFEGKWPVNFENSRTEICWQLTLDSTHYNIHNYERVKNYDVVFIIFPKALVKLNKLGLEMTPLDSHENINIKIYDYPVVNTLKQYNKKVCFIQEGPCDFFTDYDLITQFNFYNQLSECDIIFSHNKYDTQFYRGLFPQSKIEIMPSLMFPSNVHSSLTKENAVIIGGNFCSWHNGFQSYIIATEFDCPIFVPSSHCKRNGEDQIPNLKHLPWIKWNDWMVQLSQFKYAIHLMPIVAAGTFSLNCAYFGIPCIGNKNVDTQQTFFPELSFDVIDIYSARSMACKLRDDSTFYNNISNYAKQIALSSIHCNPNKWLQYITQIIN